MERRTKINGRIGVSPNDWCPSSSVGNKTGKESSKLIALKILIGLTGDIKLNILTVRKTPSRIILLAGG